jgi:DNA (cytosine-5)-methyltransferase 1
MSDRLLVRNVPAEVHQWIKQQRQQQQMSQQEFLLSLLHRASAAQQGPMLPFESSNIEVPVQDTLPFTFIDLFAGIGGFRIALKELGGKCAYSCEWDKYSQKTYKAWFDETPHGDIRQVKPKDIPDHDVLAAGFPCQPFSIAGVSKKKSLGRAHGFKCEMQGTLFFNIVSIVEVKRPPVLFLENVKNLQSHDQGRTWSTIYNALVDLGYAVNFKVIDAADWVPQHRERIYIVCFDKKVFGENPPFEFPTPPQGPKFKDILERTPDKKYTLTDHLWTYLQAYAERHRLKGNGFGFGIADPEKVSRTLSARYYKDGSEILIRQGTKTPRRLTPRECARLMGFPDDKKIVVSDTQAYRQFGNAVVPKVAKAVGEQIIATMRWQLTRSGNGCLLKTGPNGQQHAVAS